MNYKAHRGNMSKQYTKAIIEKATDGDDFIAIASTAVEDRHGESVSVEGWDIKAFKKNPVLLWAHDHYEPAVGKATKVWIEGSGKKAALMIKGQFHEYTDRARAVKQMVQDGIISTMSVGFKPIDMDGNTFTKQELLEVSFVNVPANPQAMISAIKSLRDNGFEDTTIEELGIPVGIIDKVSKLEDEVEELKTVVKVHTSINPKQQTEKRLSQLKVVVKATDKLLEADKKREKVDKRNLVKVIKKATESIIVAEKESLNGKN